MTEIPSKEQVSSVLGDSAVIAFNELIAFVESHYGLEPAWNKAGKYGIWEVKYKKSGKTLCAFYLKEGLFTALLVFGKAEREKFEPSESEFNSKVVELYNSTPQFHDGKWLWIDVHDMSLTEDIKRLILIKKKPGNKK